MAAKGNQAKENLIKQIAGALPAGTYIGCYDKKYYFWSTENGEKIQVAITMTCPKNPVGEINLPSNGGIDFTGKSTVIAPTAAEPAEISEEEKNNIAELMRKLGL